MACRILFFDHTLLEKRFFEVNKFDNFDIKFFEWELNKDTVGNLAQEDLDNTVMINIYKNSVVDSQVMSKFKNLRLVAVRSEDYDNVDVGYCLNNNIALINVEYIEDPHSMEYRLKASFRGMADFLCGGKSNRVV